MMEMTPMVWLGLGLLLLCVELSLPGMFMLWLAGAAALTAVVSKLIPMSNVLEVAVFAAFSTALVVWAAKNRKRITPGSDAAEGLNEKHVKLIGRTLVISENFNPSAPFVSIDDSRWPVHPASANLQPGDLVRVAEVDPENKLSLVKLP